MPTPHNRAGKNDIARIVLMPGDPFRAQYVAKSFMDDGARLVTDVRNMFGFSGTYKGVPVSCMASGMGAPSIGIYSYELFTEYDVDVIIRIGTSGGLQNNINVGDVVFAMTASTDGAYANQYELPGSFSPCADYNLLKIGVEAAENLSIPYYVGPVFSSDYFSDYNARGKVSWQKYAALGSLVQDMETYALYCNAAYTHKRALSVITMTDNCVTGESLKDEERMSANGRMIRVALEIARSLGK